jgi:hypothetical protein
MESELVKGRHYIECQCASTDHLLVIDTSETEEDNLLMVSIYFVHNYRGSFFRRLKLVFEYLFNINKYALTGDDVLFDESNVDQLEKIVNVLKKQRLNFWKQKTD